MIFLLIPDLVIIALLIIVMMPFQLIGMDCDASFLEIVMCVLVSVPTLFSSGKTISIYKKERKECYSQKGLVPSLLIEILTAVIACAVMLMICSDYEPVAAGSGLEGLFNSLFSGFYVVMSVLITFCVVCFYISSLLSPTGMLFGASKTEVAIVNLFVTGFAVVVACVFSP